MFGNVVNVSLLPMEFDDWLARSSTDMDPDDDFEAPLIRVGFYVGGSLRCSFGESSRHNVLGSSPGFGRTVVS